MTEYTPEAKKMIDDHNRRVTRQIIQRNGAVMRCKGCGEGEGHDINYCDKCGIAICGDCEPYREDDAPIDLCESCYVDDNDEPYSMTESQKDEAIRKAE